MPDPRKGLAPTGAARPTQSERATGSDARMQSELFGKALQSPVTNRRIDPLYPLSAGEGRAAPASP